MYDMQKLIRYTSSTPVAVAIAVAAKLHDKWHTVTGIITSRRYVIRRINWIHVCVDMYTKCIVKFSFRPQSWHSFDCNWSMHQIDGVRERESAERRTHWLSIVHVENNISIIQVRKCHLLLLVIVFIRAARHKHWLTRHKRRLRCRTRTRCVLLLVRVILGTVD